MQAYYLLEMFRQTIKTKHKKCLQVLYIHVLISIFIKSVDNGLHVHSYCFSYICFDVSKHVFLITCLQIDVFTKANMTYEVVNIHIVHFYLKPTRVS